MFGEIEDEHDKLVLTEKVINDGVYLFSARLDVDYLNETYKLNLPENENYETLGGMIVSFTEGIPKKDEVIVLQDYTFNILEVSNTKLELVEVKYTPVD